MPSQEDWWWTADGSAIRWSAKGMRYWRCAIASPLHNLHALNGCYRLCRMYPIAAGYEYIGAANLNIARAASSFAGIIIYNNQNNIIQQPIARKTTHCALRVETSLPQSAHAPVPTWKKN